MASLGMNQVYTNWIKDINESLDYLKEYQTDSNSDFQNKLTAREQKLKSERAQLEEVLTNVT
jgi:hypothetical protein|tara:strand:- start:258 stop:443 length:186 start_codon:yes stop_codon:yes gene_type:complete